MSDTIAEVVRQAEERKAAEAAEAAARRRPLRKVLGATFTEAEETEVVLTFRAVGFPKNPDGSPNKAGAARLILIAFSRSLKVRDAVGMFLHDNPELLTD